MRPPGAALSPQRPRIIPRRWLAHSWARPAFIPTSAHSLLRDGHPLKSSSRRFYVQLHDDSDACIRGTQHACATGKSRSSLAMHDGLCRCRRYRYQYQYSPAPVMMSGIGSGCGICAGSPAMAWRGGERRLDWTSAPGQAKDGVPVMGEASAQNGSVSISLSRSVFPLLVARFESS